MSRRWSLWSYDQKRGAVILTLPDEKIDMNSVCWYEVPENTAGYENVTWWGAEVTDKDQKNLKGKLPFISSYLNTTVKNRYLFPIATSSIADSQGKLSNSYGY
jgi:starch-binding outer membrane protein, SusD/RagB family